LFVVTLEIVFIAPSFSSIRSIFIPGNRSACQTVSLQAASRPVRAGHFDQAGGQRGFQVGIVEMVATAES
jgi:hypothetical protein